MDEHYDTTTALNAMEAIAKERQVNPNAGPQLATVIKENGDSDLHVFYQQSPKLWRLVNGVEHDLTEVVLSVQGIVWQKDLPPFYARQRFVQKRAQYLKQSISLTGLGSPIFQNAVNNAIHIYGMFSRYLPEKKLQKWNPSEYRDTSSLDMGNRIFTPRRDNPTSPHIPFNSEIDPDGKLTGLMSGELFHGEDNRVQYMWKTTGDEGNVRYVPIPPITFQTGDIVEAKVSFVVTPVRGGDFKMLTVLRGLTLLDASHSQRAFVARMGQPTIPRVATLKRQVGYEEEEYAETRERLNKMRIEKEAEKEAAQVRIDNEPEQEVEMASAP